MRMTLPRFRQLAAVFRPSGEPRVCDGDARQKCPPACPRSARRGPPAETCARCVGRSVVGQNLVHEFAVKHRPRHIRSAANVPANNSRQFFRDNHRAAAGLARNGDRAPHAGRPRQFAPAEAVWLLMKEKQWSKLALIINHLVVLINLTPEARNIARDRRTI